MIIKTLNIPYVISSFDYQTKIKEDLLNDIENSDFETKKQTDDYYSDNIYKLDWFKNTDFDRPWVKRFEPYFKNQIIKNVIRIQIN